MDSNVQAGVQRGIDACNRWAQACEECLISCLREPDVQARASRIQARRDGIDPCWTASRRMSRGSAYAAAICRVCAAVCDACARECAEECRRMAAAA